MPSIDPKKCTQCNKCVKDCPSEAIDISRWHINNTCIHCGHCVAICPELAVKPDTGEISPLQSVHITASDYSHFTAGIRSCRSYKGDAVPENLIKAMVENMRHYPSASNKRKVEVNIITDKHKIQALNDATAQTLLKAIKLLTNPLIAPLVSILSPQYGIKSLSAYQRKYKSRQKTNPSQICHGAPMVMLFHGPAGKYSLAKDDALIWATNTTQFAHAAGLGSCFIGFIVKAMERSKAMRKQYGIPDANQVYAVLTVGYPKVHYQNEVSRKHPEYKII